MNQQLANMKPTEKMRAFHGDPAIKAKYLARVAAHWAEDELIHGYHWQGGKGCAVGCTVHSNDHLAYERELGIPSFIAGLEDGLFERMPNEAAQAWPYRLLKAIKAGADLSKVGNRFLVWILMDPKERIAGAVPPSEDVEVLQKTATLFQRRIKGDEPTADQWNDVSSSRLSTHPARRAIKASILAKTAPTASAGRAAISMIDCRFRDGRARVGLAADKLIELLKSTRKAAMA